MCVPTAGNLLIARLFTLPGVPALALRLFLSIVGFVGLAWLLAQVVTHVGDLTIRIGFRNARPLKRQLVRVVFRIATIVVVVGITLKELQILGVPVAGLIAGLGVGGLAIALAAQGTLENFIGGIILYADQPVKVGDFCRFGDRLGAVEDVGLRSVKIRTLGRTVVTVPNAEFAKLHLENLTDRDRTLLSEKIRLRYETTRSQLRQILAGIEALLRDHPRIADEPLRVRFTGFGQSAVEVELFAYAVTTDWAEFLEIKEGVLLDVIGVVERSGTRLALPTEVHYAGERSALEPEERPGRDGT
jgi:small-conductance mechanosensitive channel